MDLMHDTVVFDRTFPASPERLFQAYADPKEREIWSPPFEGTAVSIDSSDFRAGGQESARCGPVGDLKYRMEVRYHVVELGRHISFTETLWEGEMLLTVSQSTFEISPAGEGARLRLTDQMASYIGQDGLDGHREGYARMLDNLVGRFAMA
ncbi:MAG: SRPBCC domain-containing protein [Pseudomonadota bacterium]